MYIDLERKLYRYSGCIMGISWVSSMISHLNHLFALLVMWSIRGCRGLDPSVLWSIQTSEINNLRKSKRLRLYLWFCQRFSGPLPFSQTKQHPPTKGDSKTPEVEIFTHPSRFVKDLAMGQNPGTQSTRVIAGIADSWMFLSPSHMGLS